MTPDPLHLAAAWVAGTAGAAAALAWGRVGGLGLRLLIVTVAAGGLGVMWVVGGGAPVLVGLVGLAVVAAALTRPRIGAIGWVVVSLAALPSAAGHGWAVALGDSVLLGSITVGLCLGHWFLVDPHLPRRPMRLLSFAGLGGLAVASLATLLGHTSLPAIGEVAVPIAVVSGVVTAIVLAAVPWSLAIPTYKAVQSATGLFYVSTMSVAGFVIVTSALRMGLPG